MDEKLRRRGPLQRATGARSPTFGPNPAGLHQCVKRALSESDPSDLLDFSASDRLVVYNHSEGLDRRPRQLARDRPLCTQLGCKVGGSPERPAARQPDDIDAAAGIFLREPLQQFGKIRGLVQMLPQSLFSKRLIGG